MKPFFYSQVASQTIGSCSRFHISKFSISFKLIAVFILFSGFNSFAFSQAERPVITFDNGVHDFGVVQEEAGPVSHVFTFTNTGRQPLVIHNVRTSCGCTVPEWTRTPIQPGGRGTLKAIFDPRGRPGHFNQSITVTSNASTPNETIRIIGRVAPRTLTVEDNFPREMGGIRLQSSHLAFTRVEPGTRKEEALRVINVSNQPVAISFHQVPAHVTINAVPQTLAPGQEGLIQASFDASRIDDWGFIVNQVFVALNGTQHHDYRLSVSATIEEDYSRWTEEQMRNAPDIQFRETSFDFGEVREGAVVSHNFQFTNNGRSNLVLRRVRASCGCTATKPETNVIPPGGTSIITVEFNSRGRNGRQNQSVTVYSNDPRKSTMLLRVSANVVR